MASKALFTLATFFTRCSLISFYFRLVSDSGLKRFRWALHSATAFNIAVCIAFLCLTVFQCRYELPPFYVLYFNGSPSCSPVKAYWIFPASGHCMDEGKVTLAAGIINCVLDLLVTILPLPMIVKLQMRLRQRLGVMFLLSLGFVVTIAGIVRYGFPPKVDKAAN
jgi:hypothetical protein